MEEVQALAEHLRFVIPLDTETLPGAQTYEPSIERLQNVIVDHRKSRRFCRWSGFSS